MIDGGALVCCDVTLKAIVRTTGDAYTLSEEERTSYLMGWRIQLLQGTLTCLAECPLLLQAFMEDEAMAPPPSTVRVNTPSSPPP